MHETLDLKLIKEGCFFLDGCSQNAMKLFWRCFRLTMWESLHMSVASLQSFITDFLQVIDSWYSHLMGFINTSAMKRLLPMSHGSWKMFQKVILRNTSLQSFSFVLPKRMVSSFGLTFALIYLLMLKES